MSKVTCPVCGREYKTYIQSFGDGSIERLRKHYKIIPSLLSKSGTVEKVVCKGSYRLIIPEEE